MGRRARDRGRRDVDGGVVSSPRENALLIALASACKAAGLLDAELPPTEMVAQAQILLDAMGAQGLEVTLDASEDQG